MDGDLEALLNTNAYIAIAFLCALGILLLCTQCHRVAGCGQVLCSEPSTTSFTLSFALVLLYLVILNSIRGSITTDRFLVYFVAMLSAACTLGYVKLAHYVALSAVMLIEFSLCAVLQQIIGLLHVSLIRRIGYMVTNLKPAAAAHAAPVAGVIEALQSEYVRTGRISLSKTSWRRR